MTDPLPAAAVTAAASPNAPRPSSALAIEIADARVAELKQLAAAILATFVKTDAGYRARAGQVQISKWETILRGDQP